MRIWSWLGGHRVAGSLTIGRRRLPGLALLALLSAVAGGCPLLGPPGYPSELSVASQCGDCPCQTRCVQQELFVNWDTSPAPPYEETRWLWFTWQASCSAHQENRVVLEQIEAIGLSDVQFYSDEQLGDLEGTGWAAGLRGLVRALPGPDTDIEILWPIECLADPDSDPDNLRAVYRFELAVSDIPADRNDSHVIYGSLIEE